MKQYEVIVKYVELDKVSTTSFLRHSNDRGELLRSLLPDLDHGFVGYGDEDAIVAVPVKSVLSIKVKSR